MLWEGIWKQTYFSVIYWAGSDSKESACSEGDPGLIPGLGRSPGEGNGNLLQYSCLENPMDGGAWQVTVSPWVLKESDMTERLHLLCFLILYINNTEIYKYINKFYTIAHLGTKTFIEDYIVTYIFMKMMHQDVERA